MACFHLGIAEQKEATMVAGDDRQLTDDFLALRSQFPILQRTVHGKPLTYLDSAATSQKPSVVLDAERVFYEQINAGVHRGAHELAALSTLAFERARDQVAALIGAHTGEGNQELIVTSGATGGMNMLAYAFNNASLGAGGHAAQRFALHSGDAIVVSRAEHHSVLLPMQELAARFGAQLKWLEVDESGRVNTDESYLRTVIDERTKIVAITHVSNVTGAITDVEPVVRCAHEVGAVVVLDMCQSVPHIPVDVHALDVDFAVLSVHKMYGPTGVGFLYGKRALLESLPPAYFGGSMVELAWLNQPAQYMLPPAKFEAGTQPVAQVVAAGVAAQWLQSIGMDCVMAHEQQLLKSLLAIAHVEGVRVLGPLDAKNRIGTLSFTVDGVHPHDVGQFLDAQGIAIRVGHHCAQPIHRHFGVFASNRVSLGVYNTREEVERLITEVAHVRAYFATE